VLQVHNISSGYGNRKVFSDISFLVPQGKIVLLTGGNGSGKSTILKCIFGILPIWNEEGSISYYNQDLTKFSSSEMAKIGISYIPQKNNYFESLTVHENLTVSGSTCSNKEIRQRQDYVYQLPFLSEKQHRTPFNLSGGEKQILALGNALMQKPTLILFDEPFAGLDEANTKVLIEQIEILKNNNIGMLIVEHKQIISPLADSIFELNLGKVTQLK